MKSMQNLNKLILLIFTVVVFVSYDFLYLDRFTEIRVFNLVAEMFFVTLAAMLFFSINDLQGRSFYKYLNIGFFLAFVSMLVDSLDQLHYHGELYTAIGEKLTLIVGFILIVVGVKEWIIEFGKLNKRLERQVVTDELTGLYNRRGMVQQFEMMQGIAVKNDLSLSFVIADLDDFKIYNDTMGHLEGDDFLKEVGRSLLKLMSKNKVIGRWGGEEFAICLLGSDLKHAVDFAEKIRQAILQLKLPEQMKNNRVTMSLGVAELTGGERVMDSVKRADRALYKAKKNGKNRVLSEV